MLHVLCVHGAQQTSEIFEHQLSRLQRAVRDIAVFEYVDAPHVLPRRHSDDAVQTRSWCRSSRLREDDEGGGAQHDGDDDNDDNDSNSDYDDGDAVLVTALQRRRYDVLLGFSQGALMLCRLYLRDDAVACAARRSVRAVVLAGAPDPRRTFAHDALLTRYYARTRTTTTTATTTTASAEADMSALFAHVPSLHLVGERDAVVHASESAAFARACGAQARLLLHEHGHCVPQLQHVCAAVRALLIDVSGSASDSNHAEACGDDAAACTADATALREARAQELAMLASMYGDDAVMTTTTPTQAQPPHHGDDGDGDAVVQLRLLSEEDVGAVEDGETRRVLLSVLLQLTVPPRYPAVPPRVEVVGGPAAHNTAYENWRRALARSCAAYMADNRSNSDDSAAAATSMLLLPTYLHANAQAVEQLPTLLQALAPSSSGTTAATRGGTSDATTAAAAQGATDNNSGVDDDIAEDNVDDATREQRIAEAEEAAAALLLRRPRRRLCHTTRVLDDGNDGDDGDDSGAVNMTAADAEAAVAAARELSRTALRADAAVFSHSHSSTATNGTDSNNNNDDDEGDVGAGEAVGALDAVVEGGDADNDIIDGSSSSSSSSRKGGSWTLTIGLIGKPSAGKSTLYNAITDPESEAAAARVAPFPFTTIDPNIGRGYAPAYCPCSVLLSPQPQQQQQQQQQKMRLTASFTVCDAAYGHVHVAHDAHDDKSNRDDEDNEQQRQLRYRRHPVRVKDVAGLVRGAYRGRGRGNRFLNDLCDADVLVHVVDGAGVTDAEGVACAPGRGSALDDVTWVRNEVHHWIYDNLAHKWPVVRRQPRRLYGMFSGYRSAPAVVARVLRRMGVASAHALDAQLRGWGAAQVHLLVALYIRVRFPLVVAVNKADVTPHAAAMYTRLRRRYPDEVLVPMAARVECDLLALRKRGRVTYAAGDASFTELPHGNSSSSNSNNDATSSSSSLTTQDATMLTRVRAFFDLDSTQHNAKSTSHGAGVRWVGSTGVQRVLAAAVARCGAVLVYPVTTLQPAVSSLRDCYAFKPGTTADAVFVRLTYAQLLQGKLVRFELADVAALPSPPSSSSQQQQQQQHTSEHSSSSGGGGGVVVTLKRGDVLPTRAALVRILTNKKQLGN